MGRPPRWPARGRGEGGRAADGPGGPNRPQVAGERRGGGARGQRAGSGATGRVSPGGGKREGERAKARERGEIAERRPSPGGKKRLLEGFDEGFSN